MFTFKDFEPFSSETLMQNKQAVTVWFVCRQNNLLVDHRLLVDIFAVCSQSTQQTSFLFVLVKLDVVLINPPGLLPPAAKLRQGNVFKSVCHSFLNILH